MVEEGKEALLVPPRDHVSFADAIGRLLDDPEERKRLGEAAQRRQRAQFRFDQTIAQLESLYETLYAEARRGLVSRRSPASADDGRSPRDG